MPPPHRTTVRRILSIVVVTMLALCGAESPIRGHEGHGGVVPIFKEMRVAGTPWRVGVGIVPADPLAGEQVRVEIRAVPVTDGIDGPPAGADQIRASIGGSRLTLTPVNADGVLGADLRIDAAGAHEVRVELGTTGGASAEFPFRVQPGPARRLRQVVALAFLLLIAAVGAFMSGSLRTRWTEGSTPQRATIVGIAAVLLVAAWSLSGVVAGVLAREFLPDRSGVEVDWIPEAAPAAGAAGAGAGADAVTASGPASDAAPADGIPARVVAAPGRVAEIIVPMPGRLIAIDGARVSLGARVTKGQELTRLQPSYIMHDALHLINQRWPILQSMVDAKRTMLMAEAEAERLKLAVADKAASTSALQTAETAAIAAKADYDRWSRTLRMHDVQIVDDQPTRLAIKSPISGEIAAANFAQGQLVYEGDPLFTIVDITSVWVEARVPEPLAGSFHHPTVDFVSPTFPGMTFTGRLQRVAPAVEPQSRTLSHFYAVDNPGKLLRVGMLLRTAGRGEARPVISS